MKKSAVRRSYQNIISVFMALIVLFLPNQVFAHDAKFEGYSQWEIKEKSILGTMQLQYTLMEAIRKVKNFSIPFDDLSDAELKKTLASVFQPYLDEKLSISVNNKKVPIKTDSIMRGQNSSYTLAFSVDSPDIQKDKLESIKIDYNMLFDETDQYHVNIAVFSSTVFTLDETLFVFTSSSKTDEILFKKTAESPTSKTVPFWTLIGQFIVLGIKHILSGYDHILFLLALVSIGLSHKEALKVITSFTIAHSITLLLAALKIVSLPSRFVESVIALSICYVAAENILTKKVHKRWIITFCFGLVHGFGFASILQEYVINKSDLIFSVLSFNLGVEVGQLIIFIVILPILYFLKKKLNFRKVTISMSSVIFVLGFIWLIQRVFI